MKASIVDLRYHMNDVLKALARNQTVTIIYHGKEKGIITPIPDSPTKKKVEDTQLFGMNADDKMSVDEIMEQLRGARTDDL